MYLWVVFAESILAYGGFVFTLEGMTNDVRERFNKVYRKSLKYVLGLSQNSRSD